VILVAANACGSDTAEYTIGVVPNEVTAFFNTDPVIGCGPLTVELTNFSAGDTAIVWDLGDGNVSIAEDLTHTYTQPGTYTIELSAFGCGFDLFSTDVTVLPYPEVAFTTDPVTVCAGDPFTFTNLTPNSASVQWDFGDGSTSTLSAPTHAYANGGNYNVSLTVTSVLNGCPATLTQPVSVNVAPIADFTPLPGSGCIDLVVNFQNDSQNASFYSWDFGDGNTSGTAAPMHTFTQPGTHVVTLIAEHLNGCSDTLSLPVVAFPLPVSEFALSASSSCSAPVTVATTNTSQGAVSYAWDFGNGQVSQLNQPSIVFNAVGTYTVTLTATNQYGCEHSSTQAFILHPEPLAAFTAAPLPGCAGYPITFTNNSLNAQGYRWGFGDGGTSLADSPQHTYAQPGTYGITLIANGVGGCSDTLFVPGAIIVQPTPVADFLTDTLASVRNALQFNNESQGASSYDWDFGDGEHSTELHPLHLFPADGGTFTICLIAVNDLGCPDTTCRFIGVSGDPVVFVPNAFSPNGDGRNETFRPVVSGYSDWKYTFRIFDRWGLEIYRTNDRNDAWNGRVGAQDPVIDVYVWRVVLERDGDVRELFGHVTVVQ
jgi:gliding motility-associated-like protein